MTTYNTYKDSGIAWLGQIPSHWDIKRCRIVLAENTQANSYIETTKQLQFRYGEIVPKANQSVDDGVIETIRKYTVVNNGDIMINGLNLNYDFISQRVAQVIEKGCITSAYIALTPTQIADSRFYTYFLKAMDNIKMFHGMGSGVRLTLSYKELKNMYIPIPPLYEQRAMADYIDEASAKIDEAIAQQQKMIDLLKERKQIIINEAVTHGLDPNVPMKPTGIDWLPQIPAHWHIRRMASLGTFSKGSGISRDDLSEEGLPAILYGDIYTKYEIAVSNLLNHISEKTAANAVKINAGDILLTGSGETKEDIGKAILYNGELAYAGGDVIIFRQQRTDGLFLSYVLNSFYARYYKAAMSKGEIVVHTYPYMLKNLVVPIPPIKEQRAIAVYLEEKCQTINMAIERHEKMISLLTERKQIIINDVVTGKIKVI